MPLQPGQGVGKCSAAELETYLDRCLSIATDVHSANLIATYLAWGYALRMTVADGDCPVDAVAIQQGRPRTGATYKAIRELTADAMQAGSVCVCVFIMYVCMYVCMYVHS